MTNNMKYFLVVAEELSIRRAAEKVFISPQCMSNHIKRLEESYGVKLFQRKPRFELTAEGIALVKNLWRIQILENAFNEQIKNISDSVTERTLRIGMHSSRARSMMPEIYSRFHEKYPYIKFSVYNGVVAETEKMVISGDLNFFIGPYLINAPELNVIKLLEEETYYVVPDNVLKEHFDKDFPRCKDSFKKGIYIRDFEDIPILISNESSMLHSAIDNFLKSNRINPRYIFETNSNDLLFDLTSMGYGASFCPAMMLNLLYSDRAKGGHSHQLINVFPIKGYSIINRIVLAYHKDTYLPDYALYFIDIVKKVAYEMGLLFCNP